MVKVVALALLAAAAVAVSASSQTIHVTTNNVFDLNPSRDSLTGLAGEQRIRAAFTDGTDPVDVSDGVPIPLVIKSRVDDYRVVVINSATSTPPNVVWWPVPSLNAGEYDLTATVTLPDDAFPVFHRWLTLTNAPEGDINVSVTGITVEANTTITNIIQSSLNIYYSSNIVASVTNEP